MKKIDKIQMLIIHLFLAISSILIVIIGYTSGAGIGQPGNDMVGKGYFKAFTVDSNLFLAIISIIIVIILLKNWNKKNIILNKSLTLLSLSATTSVMLTFLTVLLFLEPMFILNGFNFIDMYYNGLFFFHFLNPLLALYSFIKLQKITNINNKELLLTIIPVIIYSIIYIYMVLNNIWEDFYNFTFGGKYYLIPLIVIIMYSITYLISLLIMIIKNKGVNMKEKNQKIIYYINEMVKEINNKYPNIIDNEKVNKAIEIYTNKEDSFEDIKKDINKVIEQLIKNYKRQKEIEEEAHYDLNDYFDCRISHNTLHIHLIPKDIKKDIYKLGLKYYDYVEEKLVDALEKIPEILKLEENKNIKKVLAVSHLLRTKESQELFKKYNFDVSILREGKFVDMFDGKRVGLATIPRDKFLELYDKKRTK